MAALVIDIIDDKATMMAKVSAEAAVSSIALGPAPRCVMAEISCLRRVVSAAGHRRRLAAAAMLL